LFQVGSIVGTQITATELECVNSAHVLFRHCRVLIRGYGNKMNFFQESLVSNHRSLGLFMIAGLLPLFLAMSCSESASGNNDAQTGEPDGVASGVVDPENKSEIHLPETLYNYAVIDTPAHFEVESERFHQQQPLSSADNTPASNPITDEGATLGRVLFYDKNLSANRTVACASCHKPELGFSDDRVLSVGFDGGETARHSMGLTNARYYAAGQFFWDQRAATLEDQVLMPFLDEVEMGMTLETLVQRVQGGPYYPELFEAAFGDMTVTPERISRALAQFIRSIVSTKSRYDVGRAQVSARSVDFPNFTAEENLGKFLFSSPPPRGGFACFVCHQGEGMVPVMATSNGLDATITDRGYGEVTGRATDEGTFKVPSLRNVELTAPYMHDGRFATLEEVIDHYSDGVEPSPNLSGPLAAFVFNMTDTQKAALVAFLKTLTDRELVEDPKFSDPFVK
jgi:cytochrome c peroxidase